MILDDHLPPMANNVFIYLARFYGSSAKNLFTFCIMINKHEYESQTVCKFEAFRHDLTSLDNESC